MKLRKSFQLALNILLHSKLRSWLTIVGIVIGIGSVVSIVSISQGAQDQLETGLGSLGADILTITPGFSRAQGIGGGFRDGGMPGGDFGSDASSSSDNQKNLTSRDVMILNNLENVDLVMGTVSSKGDLTYSSKSASITIEGVDVLNWKDITTEEISQGRMLTSGDMNVVVLGGDVVSRTFDSEISLNSNVVIEDKTFRVVGILAEGNTVYMPIEVTRTTFEDIGDSEFDKIYVKIENIENSSATVELIEKKLRLSRGILNEKDQDFSVMNPSSMQETMQETMNTMTLFLTAIAAISLLVGAVGIANTMFTSVLEKTREIGIMKAIGAKNKDILHIFLFNSALIGFVGGFGGVILGIFGSGLVSSMGSADGGMGRMLGNTAITIELLLGALFFSVIVGMIAGVIPAYRASKLNPVDALRSE